MKAVEANFIGFLQQPKQFIIPIYQRTYSWELGQCQQLWRDVLRVSRSPSGTGHFIGSIVYIAAGKYAVTLVPQLLVIDGQQRLTTLSLLLAAFARALDERKTAISISKEQIESYCLFNTFEKGDLHYKLLLTRSDKETLMRLLKGKEPPVENASPRLVENYRFFADQMANLADADLERVYEGVQRLMLVDISLDRDHDNPQLIFESLNATALKLTESDLIRNYVLMGLNPQAQTELYEDHWYPIEQGFANSGWFDWFIRDYLTVKTGAIPNVRDIYATFKAYVQSERNKQTIAETVAEMHRYAGYYVRFTQESKESDADLRAAVCDINTLKVDVARPFLLRLYEDYENGSVSKATALEVLRLIESYVFRRSVCGVPTNTLSKTFAGLDREIDKTDYLGSFKAAMALKDSYRRFPTDEEFKQEIKVKDVYNIRTRNYLLAKLENHGSKEPVNVENYTIEHILPQNPNLRSEWRAALGADWKEVHQRVLHTLGNLTLTGYNSEYSDRPFAQKRDMDGGFKDSPLRLNKGLGKLDTWGEAQIVARAEALAEIAADIWCFPAVPDTTLAKYKPPTLDDADAATLTDFAIALQGENLKMFTELRRRIENLDASVQMKPRKQFVGFDTETNFVSIIPYQSGMRVVLNVRPGDINDPKAMCKDISNIGHWGNGDMEITEHFKRTDQLDDIMELVRQAFEHHTDEQIVA